MRDYSFTRSRIFQWMGILLSLGIIAVGYWYYRSYASTLSKTPIGGITSGLVGYWSFDQATINNTTVYDRSTQKYNGTLTNGPTVTDGQVKQAVDFDGSNDYVTMGDQPNLDFMDTANFSISGWFYRDTFTTADVIVAKRNALGVGETGYSVDIEATDQLVFRISDGTNEFRMYTTSTFTTAQWTHFSLVFDQASLANTKFYINGQSVSTTTSGTITSVGDLANAIAFMVGSCNTNDPFDGKLDEIRVYNRALTAAEIQTVYAFGGAGNVISSGASQPQGTGRLDSGLAGYWALDNGSGTSATDSSVNGNTGTLTNGPTWTTGQIGGAVTFDGTDDYINVPDPSASTVLDFTTTSFSVSIWFKTSSTTARRLINKMSSTPVGWLFDVNATTGGTDAAGDLRFRVRDSGGGGADYAVALSLNDNNWHMATATVDRGGGTRTLTIFADGVSVGSTSLSSLTASVSNTEPLALGVIPSVVGNYYTGQLDEARVYNRALSNDEIAQLYRLTTPTGVDTGLKGYWSFNGRDAVGTSPTLMCDLSGTGNFGQFNNSPAVGEGKVGQAVVLDGTNDYVVFAGSGVNKVSPLLSGASQVTASAWISPTAYPTAGNSKRVIDAPMSDAVSGLIIDLFDSAGNIRVGGRSGTGDTFQSTSVVYPALNEWHFVTGVLDFPNDTIYLYLDGVLAKTTAVTFANNTYTPGTPTTSIDTIGSNIGVGSFFSGSVDEVRVYSRSLSAAEIKAQYDAGQADLMNSSASQPQGTGRLSSGLAAYYAFDDGSGSNATDSSTNGATGALNGSPSWTTGQVGGAIDLNGSTQNVSVTSPTAPDIRGSLTLSVWTNMDTLPGNGVNQMFIYKAVSGGYLYRFATTQSGGTQRIFLTPGGGGNNDVSSAITMSTGVWYNFVVTYDVNTDLVSFYQNGMLVNRVAETVAGGYNAGTGNLYLGSNPTPGEYLDGRLDEVRIYNRALSDDEVANLYRLSTPTGVDTGLKGYWSFNGQDVSGTTVYDRSGAGYTGTLTSGPVITEGKIGQALSFDGSDDYVAVGTGPSISGEVSVFAWIKPTSVSSWQGVVGDVTGGDTPGWYDLEIGRTSGKVNAVWNGSFSNFCPGSGSISAGVWSHIGFVRSGSSGNWTCMIYINGVLDNTTTSITNNPATANNLTLGKSGTKPYGGALDEVRIYNRALSADEIAALYNASR